MEIKDQCFEGLSGPQIAIRVLGGQTKAGQKFGYTPQGVQNWVVQGIPKNMVERVAEYTGIPVEMLKQRPKRSKKNAWNLKQEKIVGKNKVFGPQKNWGN